MWLSDEEYIFQQDIRDKKSAGRGAFHKKGGSKSKKCTLPSDYMTRKEKLAMSGECKNYDMKKFYTWEEFKQFPDDIQLQYLNSLINRYDVTIAAIAEELFHMTPTGLYKYLRKHELLDYINKAPYGRSTIALQGRAKFMSAIEKANQLVEEPQNDISEKPVIPEEIKVEAPVVDIKTDPKVYANCHSIDVEMDGFDSSMIDFMRLIFANQDIKVRITVDVLTPLKGL